MARKRTLNYRDYRGDFDESEERRKRDDEEDIEEEDEDEEEEEDEEDEDEEEVSEEDEDEEEVVKKKKKKKEKEKEKEKEKPVKAPRVKKPRAGKVVRMRVVWGVFDNSNKRIASYDYAKKQEAEQHAEKLRTEKKQTYFVQPVKEPWEEQ